MLLFASSTLFNVWDGAAVALFWLVATPVALVVIKRHRPSQLRASSAIRDTRPHVLVFIAGCVVFGAVGGALGEEALIDYGPLLGIAGVYAFIALRDRSARFAAWAVGVAAVTCSFALIPVNDPGWICALAMGVNLVIDGVQERNKRPV